MSRFMIPNFFLHTTIVLIFLFWFTCFIIESIPLFSVNNYPTIATLSIILEFLISFSNLILESVHIQTDELRFPI